MQGNKIFINNFDDLTLDFNSLTKIFCENSYESNVKEKHLKNYIFESIFVVTNVQENKLFFNLTKKIIENFNLKNKKVDAFLFLSFAPGPFTPPHRDDYNIYLYGLYGETLYTVGDEKYLLKNKDLLFIEKNKTHQGMSLTPRIVFSLGIRDD